MRSASLAAGLLCCLLLAGTGSVSAAPDIFARLTLNHSVSSNNMTVSTVDMIDSWNFSQVMIGMESTSGDNTDIKSIGHPPFRNFRRVFSNTSVTYNGNNLTILGPADSTVSWAALPNYTVYTQRKVPTVHTIIPQEAGNFVIAKVNTTVSDDNMSVIVNATDVIYFYAPQGIVAGFPRTNTYVMAGLVNASDFNLKDMTYTLQKNRIPLGNYLVNKDYADLLSSNQSGARPEPGMYTLEVLDYDPATTTVVNLLNHPVIILDGDNPITLPGMNPPYTYNKATGTGINLTFARPGDVTNVTYLLIRKDDTYDIRMDIDMAAFGRDAKSRWTTMHAAGFPIATIAEEVVLGDLGVADGINYTITRVGSPSPLPPVNWYTIAITPGYGISGWGKNSPLVFIPPGDLNNLVSGDYYLYAAGMSAINDVVALDQQQIRITGIPPHASFTGKPTTGQAPLTVQFNDTSTGVPAAWQWNFGDGTANATAQNPAHIYTANGDYTVTLTVTNSDGSDTLTRPGYIHVSGEIPSLPHALWGNLTIQGVPAPAGSTVVATVTGGGGSVVTTDAGRYGEPGAFGQKLLVQGHITNGSPMSFTVDGVAAEARDVQAGGQWVSTYPFSSGAVTDLDLRVNATPVPPAADFSGTPRSGEPPLQVTFTDLSTGFPVAWQWNFGDGTANATARNPSHTFQAAGTYTVTLAASNGAGTGTMMKPTYITVNGTPVPPPVANFTGTPRAGEPPLMVSFSDLSTGTPGTWQWNFGDGSVNATTRNPVHVYQIPGIYPVTLTVSNAGGSDTLRQPAYITVNEVPVEPPVANFTGEPRTGDVPLTVCFTDLTTGVPDAWQWNFGDGTANATARNPSHTFEAAGTYTVTLTASNIRGTSTVAKQDYITAMEHPLHADFVADTTQGYVPLYVTFTDLTTGTPLAWEWDFGDGTANATTKDPSHLYGSPGTFLVTLTVWNATGGTSTMRKPGYITVSDLPNPPVADFVANTTNGSAPLSVRFNDTSTGDPFSWAWNFGDNTTSAEKDPLHTYRAAGNFTVTLTVTNTGGSDTEQKDGFIHVLEEPPVAHFRANVTEGWVPLAVSFMDESTGGPSAWLWEFGDGITSTEQDPVHLYGETGTFTVNLTVTNSLGVNTSSRQDYITVTLPSPPVAEFYASPLTGYAPQLVQFYDMSTNNPTSWYWNFGNGYTSTDQNPAATYYVGIYTISLEVSNAGGSNNITKFQYINIFKSGGGGSGGGGGGGGGGGYTFPPAIATPTPIVTVTPPLPSQLPLDADNRTTREVVIVSSDGNGSLWIDKGVQLTCDGEALRTLVLSAVNAGSLPPVPDEDRYAYTGYAYKVEPLCGVFAPGATLSITLSPADWANLQNAGLTIRWWSESTGSWTALPTSLNTNDRTASVSITQAGTYALFRTITVATTIPTTVPETTVPVTTPPTPPPGLPWNIIIPGAVILVVAICLAVLYYMIWGRKPPGSPTVVQPEEALFEE